jgi:PTH1 family peptidyl-tRNA hydrolase
MPKGRLFGAAGFRKKPAADLKSEYYIIGLGNPGGRYAHTRHNAGFDVVSILSQRHKIPVRIHKFEAALGKGEIEGKRVLLVMPQTYMNNSGQSVKALCAALGIKKEQLILVYDDVDLKEGVVRVKARGSAGTHNGMKSVVFHLQTDELVRVRVGIGRPEGDIVDHVLGEYTDREAAFGGLMKAADAVETILKEGVLEAQNRFN